MLLIVVLLMTSLYISLDYRKDFSRYLDVFVLDVYLDCIYYLDDNVCLNQNKFIKKVDLLIYSYHQNFISKEIEVNYYFKDIIVQIDINYSFFFPYQIIKEVGLYEK